MKSGIAAFTLAACAAGAGLLALSGWNWWLLLVGASCIVFAYFYTAGPWPLAYHGMGDIAVILFFGFPSDSPTTSSAEGGAEKPP